MSKLKPCPFCESDNTTCTDLWTLCVEIENAPATWACKCDDCGAMGPYKKSMETAIAAWNLSGKEFDPAHEQAATAVVEAQTITIAALMQENKNLKTVIREAWLELSDGYGRDNAERFLEPFAKREEAQ